MQMLNVQQVADMFCVKKPTVRKWVRDGLLTPVKVSRNHLAFLSDEVERLARESAVKSNSGLNATSNGI